MLEQIARSRLKTLTLGVRDHAALLGQESETCEKIFRAADHTCHVCGVQTFTGLEIDHGSRHVPLKNKSISGLKPICQFCHNLKHPLWAASRGRLVAIYAPDISQVDLQRLSWAMIAWREAYPDHFETLQSDLLSRRDRFSEMMECESVEALFEASLAVIDTLGPESGMASLRSVDQVLRFIPFEVTIDIDSIGDLRIDQASRLSTWTIGGFRKFTRSAARSMLSSLDTEDLDRLEGNLKLEVVEDD